LELGNANFGLFAEKDEHHIIGIGLMNNTEHHIVTPKISESLGTRTQKNTTALSTDEPYQLDIF
jgi:hypothetical protein